MKVPGVAVAVVAAFALWLLFKEHKHSATGAQGRITSMRVDGVPMGFHGSTNIKAPNGEGTIIVTWSVSTKDFQGNGIRWNYKLRFMVQQGSAFSFESLPSQIFAMNFLATLSHSFPYTVHAAAPGGLYSVTAFLQAEGSNAAGAPTGEFADIPGVTLTHTDAINVVLPPTAGPVTPQGAIGTVDVAQAILRQMQS